MLKSRFIAETISYYDALSELLDQIIYKHQLKPGYSTCNTFYSLNGTKFVLEAAQFENCRKIGISYYDNPSNGLYLTFATNSNSSEDTHFPYYKLLEWYIDQTVMPRSEQVST